MFMTQFHLFIQTKIDSKEKSVKGDAEISPEHSSALQALALSNIKKGMVQNITRAQGLQEELGQRRASLLQDSAEAQALKGQEALLAEIVEEEMAHQTQVSVLSHLHL